MPEIHVLTKFEDNPYPHAVEVDTTSHGSFKDLSPFFLGPLTFPNGDVCIRFENFWQYSKAYPCHIDPHGHLTQEYWDWRTKGFASRKGERYPLGKGIKPVGSIFLSPNGVQMLGYIEARKKLYIPHFVELVKATKSYSLLYKWFHTEKRDIVLRDFDGYNHKALGMSLKDVVNNTNKSLGHAFIIYGMLTGEITELL